MTTIPEDLHAIDLAQPRFSIDPEEEIEHFKSLIRRSKHALRKHKKQLRNLKDDDVYEIHCEFDYMVKRETIKKTPKQIRLAPRIENSSLVILNRKRLVNNEILNRNSCEFALGRTLIMKINELIKTIESEINDLEHELETREEILEQINILFPEYELNSSEEILSKSDRINWQEEGF